MNKNKKLYIVIPAAALLIVSGLIGTAYASGFGNMNSHMNNPEAIDAIESNDYNAFLDASLERPFAVEINEDTFNAMSEAHALMEDGDIEGAHEIMEEIGFPMHGPHNDMRKGDGTGNGIRHGVGDGACLTQ